ncbi:MAG: glycosyltransferase [Rikenellaceae bacterium]
MNILFLIGVYPNIGGTEKIATILANQFASQGGRVCIASFEQPMLELSSELDRGVALRKLESPILSRSNVEILRGIIAEFKIDIIMNQWCLPFYTTMLCNRAIKGTNCKLLSVLHGVPNNSLKVILAQKGVEGAKNLFTRAINRTKLFLTHQIIKRSIKYTYKNSDRYILLSKGYVPIFQEYTNVKDLSKLVVIGNPVTISTDYSTNYLAHKKRQILYVGRMDIDNKRVDRIIDIWADIYDDYEDWELVLVGGGSHLETLERSVAQRAIKRVTFTGFVKEDPIQYYKDASILMLTSDLEGFGLVIVEGMSYGVVPVVYGSTPSFFDIIDHEKSGFITDAPYSHAQNVSMLRSLIDDPKILSTMSIEAQNRSKSFLLGRVIDQWNQLLKSL